MTIEKNISKQNYREKITLLSWNVNGIRSAYRKGFLPWLTEVKPDILCLQEIRATETQLHDSLAMPDGYYSYWNSSDRAGYGGTALFSRKKPLSITYGLGDGNLDREGRTIIAEYPNFFLINSYFPNGNRNHDRLLYKLNFYEAFQKKCDDLHNQGKVVIFCGDLNTAHKEIDLFNPKTNKKKSGFLPEERKWIDRMIESGYVDTFRYFYPNLSEQYSWWSYMLNARENNRGWRFDYIFIRKEAKKRILDAFILKEVSYSDHCPVGITLVP